MLAENIVLYLQNTHFVLLFNILCIEFHETFCEASLNYSQHAGCKKFDIVCCERGKSHIDARTGGDARTGPRLYID